MAYDPYKSLLANARREHLKHNADLNTHLVGNVFLPAIDSQHKKNSSASTASLKHLKVIEQCIKAESKREGRLAKCATIKERRIMTKKFQTQRERERDLIQTLMLGNFPERQHEITILEKEVVVATTPRQHLNAEVTGLSARVAAPDRVFRKADVTGGIPKTKPHAHKAFKLPECNGSPGKKSNASEQDAASVKLSSPPGLAPRKTQPVTPTRKKRSPSLSAKESSVMSSSSRVTIPSEITEAAASPNQSVQSPYMSLHQHQTRSAKATAQLSSLPNKPAEMVSSTELLNADASMEGQQKEASIAFDGALSFSEAQQFAEAMGSDAQLLKEKCEKILAEFATQTTPRLLEDAVPDTKTSSRPELPPMDTSLVAALTHEASSTTPRRPQSDRAQQSTRQSFIESLAKENKILRERKEAIRQKVDNDVNAGSESTHEDQSLAEEEEDKSQASKEEESAIDIKNALDSTDIGGAEEDQSLADEEDKSQGSKDEVPAIDIRDELNSADIGSGEEDYGDDFVEQDDEENDELETDVAETLFDLVDLVEAAIAEEEKIIVPSPRTVSTRPRSSMGRTTKYVLRIQSVFRGYRARIAFRLALYEDALSCGVLGAMPGTIQGRSGWYLDPKRLIAYYFVIPDPDGEWEQKYTLRCSRLVLTPYEMRQEVLSKAPAGLVQSEPETPRQPPGRRAKPPPEHGRTSSTSATRGELLRSCWSVACTISI
ncbi:hypothetical protein PC128_g13267 [Phytophthora cactorum]|nr:hypothetical protein PC128_g13267 [Phytophthora cactorum]